MGQYSKGVESQTRIPEKSESLFSIGNTFLWIALLLVVLVALNIVLLYVYQRANPTKDIWTVIWEYFASDTFNLVIISLLFPILSLFLENTFEVRKAVAERMENRRKTREEKEAKRNQAELEARWKCIGETSKIWNEISTLLSEVRLYTKECNGVSEESSTKNKEDDNAEPEKPSMRDLEKKMDSLANSASEMVSKWYFRFPELRSTDFSEDAEYFLDLLFCTAQTVIYFIREENDPDKMERLQCALQDIRRFVKRILYHPLMCILKTSISAREGEMENDEAKSLKAKTEMAFWLAKLRHDANKVREDERRINVIWSTLEGGENLQKAAERLEKSMEEVKITEEEISKKMQSPEFSQLAKADYPSARKLATEEIFRDKFSESSEFKEFCKSFVAIEHERLAKDHPRYSKEWIEHLFHWAHFDSTAEYLLTRAEWAHEHAKAAETRAKSTQHAERKERN